MKKKNEKFVVYMAKNTLSRSCYIGASNKGLLRKSREHVKAALAGKDSARIFYRAIRKHGPGVFVWTVLATPSSNEEMFARQMRPMDLRMGKFHIFAVLAGLQRPDLGFNS